MAKIHIAFREVCEVLQWKGAKGDVEGKGNVSVSEEHIYNHCVTEQNKSSGTDTDMLKGPTTWTPVSIGHGCQTRHLSAGIYYISFTRI